MSQSGNRSGAMSWLRPLSTAFTAAFLLITQGAALDRIPGWPYRICRANLHVHTKLSNNPDSDSFTGSLDHRLADSPTRTLEIAKKMPIDCIGLSDHGERLTGDSWRGLIGECRSNSSDKFVALRGFEWTKEGLVHSSDKPAAHVNVFSTQQYTDTNMAPDVASLYAWVAERVGAGDRPICQFNHPTYGNSHFDSFAMPEDRAPAIECFALLEIGSGPTGTYKHPSETERYYRQALREGWKVAPTIGIDNFASLKKQGARNRHTAILIETSSDSANESTVMDAIRSRRVYASEDKDFALEYWGRGPQGKRFMGDTFTAIAGDRMTLFVWAQSDSPGMVVGSSDAVGDIRLVTVRSEDSSDYEEGFSNRRISDFSYSGQKEITVGKYDICYYIKITQPDGDWIVSAPIWVKAPDPDTSPIDGKPPVDSGLSGIWEGTARASTGGEYKDRVSILQKEETLFIVSRREKVDSDSRIVLAYESTVSGHLGESYTNGNIGPGTRVLEQVGTWYYATHSKRWLSEDGEEIHSIADFRDGEHQEGVLKRVEKFADLPSLDKALSEIRGMVKSGEEADGGEINLDFAVPYLLVLLNYPGSHLDLIVEGPDGQEIDLKSSRVAYLEDSIPARLYIRNPQRGTYRFRVRGVEVEGDAEPYWVISTASELGPDGKTAYSGGGGGGGSDEQLMFAVAAILILCTGVLIAAIVLLLKQRSRQTRRRRVRVLRR